MPGAVWLVAPAVGGSRVVVNMYLSSILEVLFWLIPLGESGSEMEGEHT